MEGDEEIEIEEEGDEEMEIIDEEEEDEENVIDDSPINNNNAIIIELKTKGDPLYEKINNEILKLSLYLQVSKIKFHKLFNNEKLKSFEDALDYLEKIANQNKCVCAAIIDNIPAWKCVDCCKYESAIYCSECYKKSKHLHQNHKIYYLYSSGGMCDCGDPDSLSTFCPDHSGPFSDQDEINKYISSIFSDDIIHNLNTFFDEFFSKFSKFLILSEKFELFAEKKYEEYFNNNTNNNMDDENNNDEIISNKKSDIIRLKSTFCSLFQKLLDFFRLISNKNLGMLNILANYFLKNNLKYDKNEKEKENEEEFYKTKHRCIKITENDIQIINNNNSKMEIENEKNMNSNNLHECECCFLRLLLLNWRDNIKSQKKNNDEFILSFPRNFPLKRAFCILYFYDYEQFMLNNNKSLLHNKSQFFAEETTVLLAEKTPFIENSFDTFYNFFSNVIKSPNAKNVSGMFKEKFIKDLYIQANSKEDDIEYFTKPKIKELMSNKISIIKRIIDSICLIHNQVNFISIVPHPEFQNKGFSENFYTLELKLLTIIQKLDILIKWENYDLAKDIFQYIINKIINQEGIKQLKENEFSFHLALYRCFGLILNYFCFYYAFYNKCNIIESINFCKKNFFKSEKEINLLVDIILIDYYKLFGFISGGKNEFFNYYNYIAKYYLIYLYIKTFAQIDFTLLKYMFYLNENNFSLLNFYKKSNIENVYSSFEELFINSNNNKMNVEDDNSSNLDNNIIGQWKTLLELIIIFMKDDSSPFWCFIDEYENII